MIISYSDGGSRNNPGKAAIGIVLVENNEIIKKYKKYLGIKTNNQAEYLALLKTMDLCLKKDKKAEFYVDSELVFMQLTGRYKVKSKNIKHLYEKVKKKENKFNYIKYNHVKRENKFIQIADSLVNEELDLH